MNTPEPLFTGKNRIYFPNMESTNNYAMELIAKINPTEGTCVITDYQTAGRGQIGRSWYSDSAKNIMISYIFYPKLIKAKNQFILSIVSSLAVCATVEALGVSAKIKWPNDIYIGDLKVAGILVQNTLRDVYIKSTILGIGLNVLQDSFPAEIPNPTSVLLSTNTSYTLNEVETLLSAQLEFYYLKLRRGEVELLKKEYISKMYRYQTEHQYIEMENLEQIIEGKIIGISTDGKLTIETSFGMVKDYGFREIKFVI